MLKAHMLADGCCTCTACYCQPQITQLDENSYLPVFVDGATGAQGMQKQIQD